MGNETSSEQSVGCPYSHGFQVLRVKDNSPGTASGLRPFFDVITEANGVILNTSDSPFLKMLHESKNKPVSLRVYNTMDEEMRNTEIVPQQWTENPNELLGVSIRHTPIKEAHDFVWHVLEVFPNSPASAAQLRAHTDYIIASESVFFQDSEDFFHLINDNIGKPVSLRVYNSISNDIRSIVITPNKLWGGQGSLGCNVAYGLLHRIPTKSSSSNPEPTVTPAPQPQPTTQITAKPLAPQIPQAHVPSVTPIPKVSNITGTNVISKNSPSVDDRVQEMLQQLNTADSPVQSPVLERNSLPMNPVTPEFIPKPETITAAPEMPKSPVTPIATTPITQSMPDSSVEPKSSPIVVVSEGSPMPDLSALKNKQQDLQAQLAALRSRMQTNE